MVAQESEAVQVQEQEQILLQNKKLTRRLTREAYLSIVNRVGEQQSVERCEKWFKQSAEDKKRSNQIKSYWTWRCKRTYTYMDSAIDGMLMAYGDMLLNFYHNTEEAKCTKCAGEGFIHRYLYREQGICYLCYGFGTIRKWKKREKPEEPSTSEQQLELTI